MAKIKIAKSEDIRIGKRKTSGGIQRNKETGNGDWHQIGDAKSGEIRIGKRKTSGGIKGIGKSRDKIFGLKMKMPMMKNFALKSERILRHLEEGIGKWKRKLASK